MRYLAVFGTKWEVVDTQNNCEVVATGSKSEMATECERLNAGGSQTIEHRQKLRPKTKEKPAKPKGNGIVRLA